MLRPDGRHQYVEALKPPIGYRLEEAIGSTYSLDLDSLLTVPVSLALPGLDARQVRKQGPVTLLDAVRRVSKKLTVFCNVATMKASQPHLLYGLLEPIVVECRAPQGGCLHAKLWVLRYVSEEDGDGKPILRLVVLSRNLTADRSWDVTLQLDGVRGQGRAANRPLAELLTALPEMATRERPQNAVFERVMRLSEEVRKADWELPSGFESVAFHVLGRDRKPWLPPQSDRLLVVSPFVQGSALEALAGSTKEAVALISRADELDALSSAPLGKFGKVEVLHGAAETENGEEPRPGLQGLHAKIYVAKQAWDTTICLGSANATAAGIGVPGAEVRNVELLVELTGKTSKVGGGIDGFLGDDGMGPLLEKYEPPPEPTNPDPVAKQAERELDDWTDQLAGALRLRFVANGAQLVPELSSNVELQSPASVASTRAWLSTVHTSSSTSLASHWAPNEAQRLVSCTPGSATAIVAFELISSVAGLTRTFATNLPVAGMPQDREAHVVRAVIENRDKFFAYLMSLLDSSDGLVEETEDGSGGVQGANAVWGAGTSGLLERLLRAKARDPERIDDIRALVTSLNATEEGRKILSGEFMELWDRVAGGER